MSLSISGNAAGIIGTLVGQEGTASRALTSAVSEPGQESGLARQASDITNVSRGATLADQTSSVAQEGVANTQDQGTQALSKISQLLQNLIEMLQQLSSKISGSGTGDATGQSSQCGQGNAAQDSQSGSSGILAQLQALLQKLLTGQSDEGSSSTPSSDSTPAQQSSSQSQQDQSGGLMAKLGSALQMMGLGALLSALQGGQGK